MRTPNLMIDELYGERVQGPRWICNESVQAWDVILYDNRPVQVEAATVPYEMGCAFSGWVIPAPNGYVKADPVLGRLPPGKFVYLIERAEQTTGFWRVSWYSRKSPHTQSFLAQVLASLASVGGERELAHALGVSEEDVQYWIEDRALPAPYVLARLPRIAANVGCDGIDRLWTMPAKDITPHGELIEPTLGEFVKAYVSGAPWTHGKLVGRGMPEASWTKDGELAPPSTPWAYWCTGDTKHNPAWGVFVTVLRAESREEAFRQVLTYVPDALHRFAIPAPSESLVDVERFPHATPKRQCSVHESGGAQCELDEGHSGNHACPEALRRFEENRGLRPKTEEPAPAPRMPDDDDEVPL